LEVYKYSNMYCYTTNKRAIFIWLIKILCIADSNSIV